MAIFEFLTTYAQDMQWRVRGPFVKNECCTFLNSIYTYITIINAYYIHLHMSVVYLMYFLGKQRKIGS